MLLVLAGVLLVLAGVLLVLTGGFDRCSLVDMRLALCVAAAC